MNIILDFKSICFVNKSNIEGMKRRMSKLVTLSFEIKHLHPSH